MRPYNYVQSLIGDCGHIVGAWPQLRSATQWDGNGRRVDLYICDDCTREQYGLAGETEGLAVYVAERKESQTESMKARPKPKSPRKPRKAVPVCSICRNKGHIYSDCHLLKGSELPLSDG